MAKQIMQFRYYGEKNSKNQPSTINKARLMSGSVFANYLPITQLGIQTLPGTKFYLNNSTTPIIIGSTGIYELDLEGLSEITSISFESRSLENVNVNENAYLIIDVICEPKGGK
jgi:hypothetical protein